MQFELGADSSREQEISNQQPNVKKNSLDGNRGISIMVYKKRDDMLWIVKINWTDEYLLTCNFFGFFEKKWLIPHISTLILSVKRLCLQNW